MQLWKSLPEKPDEGSTILHKNTMKYKLKIQDLFLAGSEVDTDHLVS